MTYSAYKGRKIDFSKPVMIYKNLHNGLYSVRQGGLVVAHVTSFTAKQVAFKVNEKGRQRVIKEQKKNVHAFITGLLVSVNDSCPLDKHSKAITYNPYKFSSFVFKDSLGAAVVSPDSLVYGDVSIGIYKL